MSIDKDNNQRNIAGEEASTSNVADSLPTAEKTGASGTGTGGRWRR